jgi:DNA-binding response OmpR family regulator
MSISGSPSLSGRCVFIAEDEALIALDIVSYLEFAGCQVVGPFAEAADALQAAKTSRMDVAVLDVNLRGAPVWPVAALIQSQGVPFVFLTGYASLNEFPATFANVPRLDKPFIGGELLAVLSALGVAASPGAAKPQYLDTALRVERPILAGSA